MQSKLEMKVQNLGNALARLNEAMQAPDSYNLKTDACIKRFEFTYEVCKKTLEIALEEFDIHISNNPKEVIRVSGVKGLLSDTEIWESMREDRNDSSNEYDQEKASEIYKRIPLYIKEFEYVIKKLREKNA